MPHTVGWGRPWPPRFTKNAGRGGITVGAHGVDVRGEDAHEAGADRQLSGLIEFRFANQDPSRSEIDILPSEGQRFPEAEAGAV